MTDLLKIIRELDGYFQEENLGTPFLNQQIGVSNEQGEVLAKTNLAMTPRPADAICPFAELVSYDAKRIYKCSYKKDCDWQEQFGFKDKYCRKELKK